MFRLSVPNNLGDKFYVRKFMCCVILDLFPGMQMDRPVEDELHASHCCLVAIGRLQVIQYNLFIYEIENSINKIRT